MLNKNMNKNLQKAVIFRQRNVVEFGFPPALLKKSLKVLFKDMLDTEYDFTTEKCVSSLIEPEFQSASLFTVMKFRTSFIVMVYMIIAANVIILIEFVVSTINERYLNRQKLFHRRQSFK